jgi:hypothetical protein
VSELPPEPPGEARRVTVLLRQIAALPGPRLLGRLRTFIKTPPKTPQHQEDLVHALRNAAARITALANELANTRDTGDAA